jgi:hypothetical protein
MTDQNKDFTFEEEQQKFYKSLGEALSAWATVESAMSMIFSVLLSGKEFDKRSNLVFFSIENFRSKQQVLNSLFIGYVKNQDWLDRWKHINTILPKRASRRNQIAHHEVLIDHNSKPGRRIGIVPHMDHPGTIPGIGSGKIVPIYYKDLDAIRLEFFSAIQDMHKLSSEIRQIMEQQA